MIDKILELINSLPLIISNVAYGALFLVVFKFVTFKDKEDYIKTNLINCITTNFILVIIFNCIFKFIEKLTQIAIKPNTNIYYFLMIVFTLIFAYIFGLIVTNQKFNKILLRVGIKRTTNDNIWDDVIQSYTWLYVHMKGKDFAYLGEVKYVEEHTDNPKIVLCNYKLMKMSTAEAVVDYTDDKTRMVMLSPDDYDIVEIIPADKTKNK